MVLYPHTPLTIVFSSSVITAEHPVGDLLLMVMSTKIVNPLKVWANATQINSHYVIMFNFTRTTKPYF